MTTFTRFCLPFHHTFMACKRGATPQRLAPATPHANQGSVGSWSSGVTCEGLADKCVGVSVTHLVFGFEVIDDRHVLF
jgi:hypothetical protein